MISLVICQVSRIMGVFPVKLNEDGVNFSRLWCLYSFLTSIAISLSCLDVLVGTAKIFKVGSITASSVSFLDITVFVIVTNTLCLAGFVSSRRISNFVKGMKIYDDHMETITNDNAIKFDNLYSNKYDQSVMRLIISLIPLSGYEFVCWSDIVDRSVFARIPLYLPYFSIASGLGLYSDIMLKLTDRMKYLNNLTERSVRRNFNLTLKSTSQNYFQAFDEGVSIDVSELVKAHWMLIKLASDAGSLLSHHAMSVLLFNVTRLVVTPYYAVFYWLVEPVISHAPLVYAHATWSLVHLAHVVILVYVATNARIESEELQRILCKYLRTDSDVKHEKMASCIVKLFNHQSCFTSLGLVNLDTSILIKVGGVITTQLLVILQFQDYNKLYIANATSTTHS